MAIDLNDPEVKEAVTAAIKAEHEGLLKNRDELLNEVKSLNERVGNIDPDRYKRLTEAEEQQRAEAERQQQALIEQKKDFDGLKSRLTAQLQAKDAEIAAAKDRLDRLTQRLHRSVAEQQLREVIVAEGGVDKILTPLLRERVRIKEDDAGNYTVEVLDGQGQPMLTKSGNPAGVKDLVAEVKADADYAAVFRSSVKPGGGAMAAPVRSNGFDVDNPYRPGSENITAQRLLEAQDPQQAAAFKAAAGIN